MRHEFNARAELKLNNPQYWLLIKPTKKERLYRITQGLKPTLFASNGLSDKCTTAPGCVRDVLKVEKEEEKKNKWICVDEEARKKYEEKT